jgi:hypothetical protein
MKKQRPPARRGHRGLRPGGKVERKKLGRWENEKVGKKQDWGFRLRILDLGLWIAASGPLGMLNQRAERIGHGA